MLNTLKNEVINMAKKQREYKFICTNEPDRGCLDRVYTVMAKGLINKYGIDCIKAVLKAIKTTEEKA